MSHGGVTTRSKAKEAQWATDLSDSDLLVLCETQQIADAKNLSRSARITQCNPVDRLKERTDSAYTEVVADKCFGKYATRSEQEKCEGRVKKKVLRMVAEKECAAPRKSAARPSRQTTSLAVDSSKVQEFIDDDKDDAAAAAAEEEEEDDDKQKEEGEEKKEEEKKKSWRTCVAQLALENAKEERAWAQEWAAKIPLKDLRTLCRWHDIRGTSVMNRKTLIDRCAASHHIERLRSLSNIQLRGVCTSSTLPLVPKNATREKLLECAAISEARLKRAELDSTYYSSMQCPLPDSKGAARRAVKPSVENDTFNDCPSFYRREFKTQKERDDAKAGRVDAAGRPFGGCCVPDPRSRFLAAARVSVAASRFNDIIRRNLQVATLETLNSALDLTELTEEAKALLRQDNKEANLDLNDYTQHLVYSSDSSSSSLKTTDLPVEEEEEEEEEEEKKRESKGSAKKEAKERKHSTEKKKKESKSPKKSPPLQPEEKKSSRSSRTEFKQSSSGSGSKGGLTERDQLFISEIARLMQEQLARELYKTVDRVNELRLVLNSDPNALLDDDSKNKQDKKAKTTMDEKLDADALTIAKAFLVEGEMERKELKDLADEENDNDEDDEDNDDDDDDDEEEEEEEEEIENEDTPSKKKKKKPVSIRTPRSKKQIAERRRKQQQQQQREETKKKTTTPTPTEAPGFIRSAASRIAGLASGVAKWGVTTALPNTLSFFASIVRLGFKVGYDMIKGILQNPRTAKIITFLAKEAKDQLCRDISVELGLVLIREPESFLQKTSRKLKQSVKRGKEVLRKVVAEGVRKFTKSEGWKSGFTMIKGGLVSILSKVVSGGAGAIASTVGIAGAATAATATATVTAAATTTVAVTAGAGAALVVAPAVIAGGAVAAVASYAVSSTVNSFVSSAVDSVRTSAEYAIEAASYRSDLKETVNNILGLLDIRGCFKYQVVGSGETLAEPGMLFRGLSDAANAITELANPYVPTRVSEFVSARAENVRKLARDAAGKGVTGEAATILEAREKRRLKAERLQKSKQLYQTEGVDEDAERLEKARALYTRENVDEEDEEDEENEDEDAEDTDEESSPLQSRIGDPGLVAKSRRTEETLSGTGKPLSPPKPLKPKRTPTRVFARRTK